MWSVCDSVSGVKLGPRLFAFPLPAQITRPAPTGTPSVYHPTPRVARDIHPRTRGALVGPVGPPFPPTRCSALASPVSWMGSGSNVAREGNALALVAIHLVAVQQVTGFGLLLIRVQEGIGASTDQETRPRSEQDEEQARVESSVPVEAAGKNRSESAADLPGQKRPDAEDPVSVPTVTQH